MTAMSRPGRGCGPAVLVGTGRGRAYDGHMKRPVLLVLLVLITVAAVVAVWWSGRQPAPEGAVNDVKPFQYQADTRPTVEVYGDSISQGDSSNFSSGNTGPTSWVSHLGGPDGLRFVGGYARPGMKMTEAASEASNIVVPQQTASTVVVELGTNDINTGGEWSDFAEALEDFTSHLDVEPSGIVVVGVGPIDRLDPDAIAAWNERTQDLADEKGWLYVWPFSDLTDADGYWVPEYTEDGLHPNKSGAQVLGANMAEEVRAALAER